VILAVELVMFIVILGALRLLYIVAVLRLLAGAPRSKGRNGLAAASGLTLIGQPAAALKSPSTLITGGSEARGLAPYQACTNVQSDGASKCYPVQAHRSG
jgi:hypothetical protein